MDRVRKMNPESVPARHNRQRVMVLSVFGILVLTVLAIKAFNNGWFTPKIPLELNGEPALVFFTLAEGCECEMSVVNAAEAQLDTWSIPNENDIRLVRVDFSRRPDLANQYNVVRAPALVLLDTQGLVVWKQDVGLSDEAPLDLDTAGSQIDHLLDLSKGN
jgi:hypothetical protein